MSTKLSDWSVRAEETDVTFPSQGYDGPRVPNSVDATASADVNNALVATVFAGVYGRWSIDFGVNSGRIEVSRASRDGIRLAVDELPGWMQPVRQATADEIQE